MKVKKTTMPDVKLLMKHFENEIIKNIHYLAQKKNKSIGDWNSQIPLVFLNSEHKDQPEEKLKTTSDQQILFKNSLFLKKTGLSEIWSHNKKRLKSSIDFQHEISSFEETKKSYYKTCYIYPVE